MSKTDNFGAIRNDKAVVAFKVHMDFTIRYALKKAGRPIPCVVPVPEWIVAINYGQPVGYSKDVREAAVFTRAQLIEGHVGHLLRNGSHEAVRWDTAGKPDAVVLNPWDGYAG